VLFRSGLAEVVFDAGQLHGLVPEAVGDFNVVRDLARRDDGR